MRCLRYCFFFAAALAAVAPRVRVPIKPLSFYGEALSDLVIADVEWRGMPDFEDYVFKGTIENVVDQMRTIKGPDYTPDFMKGYSTDAASEALANVSTSAEEDTSEEGDRYITCGGPAADPLHVQEGIYYLKKLPNSAMCSMGPGPRNCGRISCSWRAGIYWCNEKTVDSDSYRCNTFATFAGEIAQFCTTNDKFFQVSGINFDTAMNASVVVQDAHC